MLEHSIESYLCEQVRFVLRGEVRKMRWINRRHAPDRAVLLARRHPLVELKRPGVKPCSGQLREHARLRSAGFEVYVIDSLAAVDAFVQEMKR